VSRKEWFQPSARRLEQQQARLEAPPEAKRKPFSLFARRDRQEPLAAE
jgi:hypothetical protein